MKTAAAYLRVSTDKQDEYSLDSQLKLIRDYASKNGFLVPDEYVFVDDGISGRSARKRPAFQRMIGWAKEKDRPFEAILVWKFSRFARNQEESIVYKSMLARSGVEVVSISEPLAEGPFGSLIERILEWMDEFYSIRLSGEVRRGMTEKVSRGEVVTVPSFGYDIVNKNYVPNADAETVRRIFRDYLAGVGMSSLARQLGAEGVRTRRGNPPDNRFIEYVLTNPVYIGKIRWSKEGKSNYQRGGDTSGSYLTDGHFPPLIPLELWDPVQEKLEKNRAGRTKYARREQPVSWMLKGLVRCSSCGSTLVYTSTACPTMQCHKYARGKCQVSHSLSLAKADRLVIEYLEQSAASRSFPVAPHAAQDDPVGPDYEHRIAQERVKLRRIQEAYETEVYTLEEYATRKKEISAEISRLQAEQTAAREAALSRRLDPEAFRERVLGVLQVLRDPTQPPAVKNEALRTVVSYIVYDKPNQQLLVYYFT